MTRKFPYVQIFRPLPSEVRQFLSQRTILILSSFSAVRHIRWHTLDMASAFVLPNLPVLHTLRPASLNACRSVDGMVSGNMDPSFPSFVVQLRFNHINLMPFALKSAYSRTCRAPPNCGRLDFKIIVISLRYKIAPSLLTLNKPFIQWGGVLGDGIFVIATLEPLFQGFFFSIDGSISE